MIKNFIFGCILVSLSINAQVGINTTAPRGVLDIVSPDQNQGMVLPSVTKVEDMINPLTNDNNLPPGTLAFDLSRNSICIRFNNVWQCTDVEGVVSIVKDTGANDYTYVKSSQRSSGLGSSVSFSNDGSILAVGSNSSVYVFNKINNEWVQTSVITPARGGNFGNSVSLSADGTILAIGAIGDPSNAQGINGIATDYSLSSSGAAYVFHYVGTQWEQKAYIKASYPKSYAKFGNSVSLSADGNFLAVASIEEGSGAVGINGNENNEDMPYSGAVFVYKRQNENWTRDAYLKASNTGSTWRFGSSVSFSYDGNTLAIGSSEEGSLGTGVNGSKTPVNAAWNKGAVYVFTRSNNQWAEDVYIKAPFNGGLHLGHSLSLSSDGNTLAVGAPYESSSATGIDSQNSGNQSWSGAVFVYRKNINGWTQESYIKPSTSKSRAFFGHSVSLSQDGSILAVGSNEENSNATYFDGDESDTSTANAGAVYLFSRSINNVWKQDKYIKASNTRAYAKFGESVALSSDGGILVVGSVGENSNAYGINGDQENTSGNSRGAAYIIKVK